VLDPKITAAGFLDPDDEHSHGIYRLLGLLAYGRICQFIAILAQAEEDEQRKQLGPRFYVDRRGPSHDDLIKLAHERRAVIATHLPPETTPCDLVLASSTALHDEVKHEIDKANVWGHYDDPEMGLRARRIVGSITGPLVDGLGEDERLFRRIDLEMLTVAAQAGATLVTLSESLAPEEYEVYSRIAPVTHVPVGVCRLWTFIDREVNRHPFDLREVRKDLLNLATGGAGAAHAEQLAR
jgi:hypothetical protein